MPVDTVWIGTSSRRSSERRFVKRAMSSRRWIWPNSGSRWRMVPKLGASSLANSTGILPTRRSSSTREAPVPPRITLAVPKVGWPANGSSSATVKMRTFTPCARSMAASRGRMKVVSERLVSRARRWNSSSRSARASVNTATAFPSRARSVKTSTTVYAKLRIRQPGLFTGATRTTGAGAGQRSGGVGPPRPVRRPEGRRFRRAGDAAGALPRPRRRDPTRLALRLFMNSSGQSRNASERPQRAQHDLGSDGLGGHARAERSQGVVYRVQHGSGRPGCARLARALEAAIGVRGGCLHVTDHDVGHLRGHGDEVVHHAAREELALLVVDEMLVQRGPDALHDGAADLLVDEPRVDDAATVLHAPVLEQAHEARLHVHLHVRKLDAVGEGEALVSRHVVSGHRQLGLEVLGQGVGTEVGDSPQLGQLEPDLARGRVDDLAEADVEVIGLALEHRRGDLEDVVAEGPARLECCFPANTRAARSPGAAAIG